MRNSLRTGFFSRSLQTTITSDSVGKRLRLVCRAGSYLRREKSKPVNCSDIRARKRTSQVGIGVGVAFECQECYHVESGRIGNIEFRHMNGSWRSESRTPGTTKDFPRPQIGLTLLKGLGSLHTSAIPAVGQGFLLGSILPVAPTNPL